MSKNILFITGTRADFGKLKPLIEESIKLKFAVSIIATGMHMLKFYGLTKFEVHRIEGAEVYELINQCDSDTQEIVLSKTIVALSDYFKEIKPEMVIVHGDRVEALAACITCALRGIRVTHVEGGEVSGSIDDVMRQCNSKLSTHHLVCSLNANKRLLASGEDKSRISLIGSPELDVHTKTSAVLLTEAKKRYQIPFDTYGIFTFHPVVSELSFIQRDIDLICKQLRKGKRNFIVIYPNNDPGGEIVHEAIMKLPANQFRILPTIRFEFFSALMKFSQIVVGNSSAGVREAPFLGVPSIDLGSRQNGRAQSCSVVNLPTSQYGELSELIDRNWDKKYASNTAYGSGQSVDMFKHFLTKSDTWSIPLQKYFFDVD